ncbi:MAG: hypothetical protein ABFR82_13850, partial [Nitrospirota bacterium]
SIAIVAIIQYDTPCHSRCCTIRVKNNQLDSSLAGFQHYKGDEIRGKIKTGDQGKDKIGYLPREHNSPIVQMMDKGINQFKDTTSEQNKYFRRESRDKY